jgi:large repetitive protein
MVFRVVPIMTSCTPTSGPPGTQVTITGGGFRRTNLVTFDGVKAIFTVDSGSQITAIVPAGAVTGHILITTNGGAATSREPFLVP